MIRLALGYCQAGYTFHEVLAAMNITMIAILGYSLGAAGIIRGTAASSHYTAALNLAQDKLEELTAQPVLRNANGCAAAGGHGTTGAAAEFERCWTIADSPLGTRLKHVTVNVSWRDYEHREISLSTLVFVP
jgi:Tfp pilus assembly protein PilV